MVWPQYHYVPVVFQVMLPREGQSQITFVADDRECGCATQHTSHLTEQIHMSSVSIIWRLLELTPGLTGCRLPGYNRKPRLQRIFGFLSNASLCGSQLFDFPSMCRLAQLETLFYVICVSMSWRTIDGDDLGHAPRTDGGSDRGRRQITCSRPAAPQRTAPTTHPSLRQLKHCDAAVTFSRLLLSGPCMLPGIMFSI